MGMERPPDRPPDEPPPEDDWLREEWLEEPTEETPPSSRRPGRRSTEPGLRGPDRRVLALVAVAALVLAVILAFVLGGDGEDDQAGPTVPTSTSIQTDTDTTTATETGPGQQIPEGQALTEGDSGRRVRQLQQALAALGYEVSADGEYGPATTEAVTAFQQDEGLEADGVAGTETIAAVNEALANRG
jgi:hypothetical protein